MPLSVLLVTQHAEEIKLLTMSLRSFYPGCRVEAVYSANEAFEWASKLTWHLILLDEDLPKHADFDLLHEIGRRAPQSAIIVQGTHDDPRIALQVIRHGADYYFFKQSHTSLLDLPLASREVLENRTLRSRLDHSEDRYRHLADHLAEVVYELDAEGRVLYISPAVKTLLDYEPQTTLKDAERLKTPVVFFSSEHDTWVDQAALKKVKASLREYAVDWYLMPEAVHNIHKRPDAARTPLYERMVVCCRAWFYTLSNHTPVAPPPDADIDRQVQLERERARTRHHMPKAENFEFWRDYLDQSQFIVNFSDYWHLLDHMYRLMGPLGQDGRAFSTPAAGTVISACFSSSMRPIVSAILPFTIGSGTAEWIL